MTVASNPWHACLGGFLLFATAVAVAPPTAAQTDDETGTIAEDIAGCADIPDDGERLACFDRLVEPLRAGRAGDPQDAAAVFVGEDGDWTSDLVTMKRRWHMTWQSNAVQMIAELRNAEGNIISVAATQVGEGDGQSDTFEPGDYRLNVRAVNGEWRIHLVEE